MAHIPVLLNEVLQYLQPKPNDNFIDCTVGEGGHALAILKMIAPNGRVLGIDRDEDMVARLGERAERMKVKDRFVIEHGNFSDIKEIFSLWEISLKETLGHKILPINGILFDFGMSSWQLEESGAGFSFQNIEPLDMRFDRTRDTLTAAVILNSWPKESIRRIIAEFGEERYARRIAEEIIEFRKKERILTTDQLARIISQALRLHQDKQNRRRGIHFATRTFQALRIAVNTELESIQKGVLYAIDILPPGGRIAAISFHSLEDRIIKNIFRDYSKKVEGGRPPYAPTRVGATEGERLLKIITKKPVRAAQEEIRDNPRARSAKLRVAERV